MRSALTAAQAENAGLREALETAARELNRCWGTFYDGANGGKKARMNNCGKAYHAVRAALSPAAGGEATKPCDLCGKLLDESEGHICLAVEPRSPRKEKP